MNQHRIRKAVPEAAARKMRGAQEFDICCVSRGASGQLSKCLGARIQFDATEGMVESEIRSLVEFELQALCG
jgi:hypothetical protein